MPDSCHHRHLPLPGGIDLCHAFPGVFGAYALVKLGLQRHLQTLFQPQNAYELSDPGRCEWSPDP